MLAQGTVPAPCPRLPPCKWKQIPFWWAAASGLPPPRHGPMGASEGHQASVRLRKATTFAFHASAPQSQGTG